MKTWPARCVKGIAAELRKLNRDDAADVVEGKVAPRQPTPEETRQKQDEEFLAQIKEKASGGWTSTPGLLEQ
jgi:hypothetical protein